MRLEEALQLKTGDRVASSFDNPAYRIRTITYGVWVNDARTDVRISLASYQNGAWVSALGFVPVPDSAVDFDVTARRWRRRSNKKDGQNPPPFIHIGEPVPPGSCSAPAEDSSNEAIA